jgi:carboxypeptidase T
MNITRSLRLLAAIVGAFVASSLAPVPAMAAADKPPGYEFYHSYAETEQVIDDAVAAHPDIAAKFSIGTSYEGRQIWGIEITRNVSADPVRPAIFVNGLMHARERASAELAIYIIGLLVDNYGKGSALGQQVTSIVDNRVVYIVPMMNPDGAEYDFSGGVFHKWRKNRQPIPGSSYIGIDLNRQFGFTWNCCGGKSSGNPASDYYRGPAPWYAPEVVAYRDFVDGRAAAGHPISEILSLHSAARLDLWPYSYTTLAVPSTMTADDHAAFVAIGKHMAALNGYRAEQGSSLYKVDGDQDDWAYHEHRIFAFTIELPKGSLKRYYPTQSELNGFLAENTSAVLYLFDQAGCPYAAAGLGAKDCGPLYDDFEIDRGWTVDPNGTDTATSGTWERADPERTADAAGVKQPGRARSGEDTLVTGAAAGASAGANAVDGTTSVLSPEITLGSGRWTLKFKFSFAHNAASTAADYLRVSVVHGGSTTTLWAVRGQASNRNGRWRGKSFSLDAYAGQGVQLLITASGAAGHLVEAELDDVRVFQTP